MSILISVRLNSFDILCRGERIGEGEKGSRSAETVGGRRSKRSKVASKQTNRNAAGSPTVINDHLVVILSPIKGVTPREASPRYSDAVEDRGSVVRAYSALINGRI